MTPKQPGNRVLAASGSPRRNGNSDILLQEIASGVKQHDTPVKFLNLTQCSFKAVSVVKNAEKQRSVQG